MPRLEFPTISGWTDKCCHSMRRHLARNNQNGSLIEAGSTEAIQKILEKLLHNPKIIQGIGREATETARKRTWKVYRQETADVVKKYLLK